MKTFHAHSGSAMAFRATSGISAISTAAAAAAAVAVAALLAGCAVGPDYTQPALESIPAAYKEGGAWKSAQPQPAGSHQPWWHTYNDATLNTLMQDAERANQTLRQAEAQYRQAQAVANIARAGLSPTLGVSAGAQRAHTDTNGVQRSATIDTAGLTASWDPDLWGGVRRSIEAGEAGVQASGDDLAGAHLSIQAALAQDYFQLRITDRLRDLYASTITAYEKSLKLTRAQHEAGVVLLSDVALSESQLATAQATAVDLEAQRAQLEHAIAILTGRAPANFSIARADADQPFNLLPPATPVGLPSQLLERRPDIAAAERRAAQANANIGVARAAYYPTLVLSASGGFNAATLGSLFDTPSRVWSLGAALAQVLFDGGLRKARDAQTVALYDAAVASYKQTVLTGMQQVEDYLATLDVLDREVQFQARAVQSSQTAERLALSQYREGTTSYINVVTAQALSLTAQRAAVTLRGRQLAASVSLVAATGGGFDATSTTDPSNASQKPTT